MSIKKLKEDMEKDIDNKYKYDELLDLKYHYEDKVKINGILKIGGTNGITLGLGFGILTALIFDILNINRYFAILSIFIMVTPMFLWIGKIYKKEKITKRKYPELYKELDALSGDSE